jgi:hypothetical protein
MSCHQNTEQNRDLNIAYKSKFLSLEATVTNED